MWMMTTRPMGTTQVPQPIWNHLRRDTTATRVTTSNQHRPRMSHVGCITGSNSNISSRVGNTVDWASAALVAMALVAALGPVDHLGGDTMSLRG